MNVLFRTFIISFFIFSATSVSAAEPLKKKDRWNELMRLVTKEMKILESARRKGPDMKYRMLELHSEILKLIHEKNNTEFLAKSTSGVRRPKEEYFRETRSYYNKTKEFGYNFLKQYPNTAHRPWVYFVLGLNSRDYGRDNLAEEYLLKTIALVNDPHNSLRHHAETALADHYYNEKKFKEAIHYYERAIKKSEDEWLTKHLFNLSWCYLKVHDFDRAIKAIQASYFKSKNRAYVNIRDQVLENIGSFYVYASRPLEGLEFYLKHEKDPIPYLMPMGMKAMDKGHQKEAEKIFAAVQDLIDDKHLVKYQEQLFHHYMDFYNHYKRFSDHEKVSGQLVKYYQKAEEFNKKTADKKKQLPVELKDDAIEKMRTLAGFLQIKVAKDMKEDTSDFSESELSIVLKFFDHLITLDHTRKVEYFYFRSETLYSVRRWKDAAPSYVEAITESKRVKDMKIGKKAFDSLLALTGMEVLPKEENKKYLIFAYSEHLAFWPRDERSEQIYPKLFEIYHEMHDDQKASQVLAVFNKYYPEHIKDQQKQMTRILDYFIEKKNTVKLSHWVNEMKAGFLGYSKDTIEKAEITLGNILFLQYQDMAKKGDKAAAAKGFEEIYVHKLYTDKVKYQAAFFASMVQLEMGEPGKAYHWLELAHARMTDEEWKERRAEELKLTERMYRLQDFVTSFNMTKLHLRKFCHLKDDTQSRFFEIGIMTALVEENTSVAEGMLTTFNKCINKPELIGKGLTQIYQFLEKKGDFHALRLFVKRHSVEPYITQYRYSLQKWYWEKSNLTLKDSILAEFKELKNEESSRWLVEMKLFEQAKKDRDALESYVIWDKPVFDGDAYNKSLETYLLKVQAFKNNYQSLTQSTQVDLAILATRHFSQVYLAVGEKIQNVRPKGMDEATTVAFSGAMKNVSKEFLSVSAQFERNLTKALKDKETLTYGSRSIASIEDVENPVHSFFTGVTMDKARD
jgi:tetratricopeptide (TPR) repeat protein